MIKKLQLSPVYGTMTGPLENRSMVRGNEIASVILYTSGAVMVFDRNGEQLTEFQGTYYNVVDAIRRSYPGYWRFASYGIFETPDLRFPQIQEIVKQLATCW